MPAPWHLLGLDRNPFAPGAVPPGACHVATTADQRLLGVQRTFLREGRPVACALVAPPGLGRSHRLGLVEAWARRRHIMHARQALGGARSDGLVPRLASALLASSPLGPLQGAWAVPRWSQGLMALARRPRVHGDAAADGQALARALGDNAPAVLLVDDLDAVPPGRAGDAYLATLAALRAAAPPGVLLLWTCRAADLARVLAREPGLAPDATVPLAPLGDAQARDLLARRLAGARVVESLDPLHPFSPAAACRLNALARGNPSRLLRLAELLVEAAPAMGSYHLDVPQVEDALLAPPGRRLLA